MNFANWELFSLFTFSLTDILDIVLIAFIIYKITTWVKDTRAYVLLRGIVVILIVSGLSFLLGLTAVWWLLRSFFNIGIIVMVIIFQPEIRRALEQLGRRKFPLQFSQEEENSQNTEELLEALYVLTKRKMGALIAIEKDVALEEYINTGVQLKALVSCELLLNIFEPNVPMHDGAIIIRENRIMAASCILPLTETEIGKELGTRHRAGVGLSEVSDALIIIVSEETGKMSLAQEGKLTKGINLERLRKILEKKEEENEKRFVFWRSKP